MPVFEDCAWLDAYRRFRNPWVRLVERAELDPTLLPDWIACGAPAAGHLSDLRVFLTFDGSNLTGLIPYFSGRRSLAGVPLRSISLTDNLVTNHYEIVAQERQFDLLAAFLRYRSEQGGWDTVFVGNVPTQGPTARALTQFAGSQSCDLIDCPGESSPFLMIDTTWNVQLASKSKKFRYKVRRREKDLQTTAGYELRWFESPQDTSGLLRDILDIEADSWKVAAGMDIPSRPMERRYHEQLLPMLSREGLLLANVLYIGGTPAAYNLCYRWNGRIGHLKTSFRSVFANLSPGAMAFEATLRRAHDDGAQEFDFLGDEMGHKLWWSTGARSHTSWLLCSRSLGGRWTGGLKRAIQASRTLRTRFSRRRTTALPETVDTSEMSDPA